MDKSAFVKFIERANSTRLVKRQNQGREFVDGMLYYLQLEVIV